MRTAADSSGNGRERWISHLVAQNLTDVRPRGTLRTRVSPQTVPLKRRVSNSADSTTDVINSHTVVVSNRFFRNRGSHISDDYIGRAHHRSGDRDRSVDALAVRERIAIAADTDESSREQAGVDQRPFGECFECAVNDLASNFLREERKGWRSGPTSLPGVEDRSARRSAYSLPVSDPEWRMHHAEYTYFQSSRGGENDRSSCETVFVFTLRRAVREDDDWRRGAVR